jgi:hypothetical protein
MRETAVTVQAAAVQTKPGPIFARAMLRAGKAEREIAPMLDALRPVVLAVERAGTKVDDELAWALLAVEADRLRRRARMARVLEAS